VRYSGTDTRESFVPDKDYSDDTARLIDEEVKRIVSEAYTDAKHLLEANWEKVEAVAGALVKYETLSGEDVEKIMGGQQLTKPTVADLIRAEAAKKAEADRPTISKPPAADLPPGAMPSPA
jgi:cell division protease FtsH